MRVFGVFGVLAGLALASVDDVNARLRLERTNIELHGKTISIETVKLATYTASKTEISDKLAKNARDQAASKGRLGEFEKRKIGEQVVEAQRAKVEDEAKLMEQMQKTVASGNAAYQASLKKLKDSAEYATIVALDTEIQGIDKRKKEKENEIAAAERECDRVGGDKSRVELELASLNDKKKKLQDEIRIIGQREVDAKAISQKEADERLEPLTQAKEQAEKARDEALATARGLRQTIGEKETEIALLRAENIRHTREYDERVNEHHSLQESSQQLKVKLEETRKFLEASNIPQDQKASHREETDRAISEKKENLRAVLETLAKKQNEKAKFPTCEQVVNLKSEAQSAKEKYEQAAKLKEQRQAKKDSLTTEHAEITSKVTELAQERENFNSQKVLAATAEEELKVLEKQLADFNASDAQDYITNLKADHKSKNKSKVDLQTKIDSLKEKESALKKQANNLSASLKSYTLTEEEIEKIETDYLEASQKEGEPISQALKEAHDRLLKFKEEASNFDEVTKEFQKVEEELRGAVASMSELEAECTRMGQAVSDFYNKKKKTLPAEIGAKREEVTSLQKAVTLDPKYDELIKKQSNACLSLENEIAELQHELDSLNLAGLQAEMNTKNEAVTELLRSTETQLNTEIGELTRQKAQLEQEISGLEAGLQGLGEACTEESQRKHRDEMSSLELQIQELDKKASALDEPIRQAAFGSETVLQKVKEIEVEVDSLKSKLVQAEDTSAGKAKAATDSDTQISLIKRVTNRNIDTIGRELKTELDSVQLGIDEVDQELISIQNCLDDCSTTCKEKSNCLADLKAQLEEIGKELSKKSTERTQADEEMKRNNHIDAGICNEHEAKMAELHAKEALCTELREKLVELERQKKQIEQDIEAENAFLVLLGQGEIAHLETQKKNEEDLTACNTSLTEASDKKNKAEEAVRSLLDELARLGGRDYLVVEKKRSDCEAINFAAIGPAEAAIIDLECLGFAFDHDQGIFTSLAGNPHVKDIVNGLPDEIYQGCPPNIATAVVVAISLDGFTKYAQLGPNFLAALASNVNRISQADLVTNRQYFAENASKMPQVCAKAHLFAAKGDMQKLSDYCSYFGSLNDFKPEVVAEMGEQCISSLPRTSITNINTAAYTSISPASYKALKAKDLQLVGTSVSATTADQVMALDPPAEASKDEHACAQLAASYDSLSLPETKDAVKAKCGKMYGFSNSGISVRPALYAVAGLVALTAASLA